MTDVRFVKIYRHPARAAAAVAHHAWLAELGSVRVPALRTFAEHELVFEHLGPGHPGPQHLDMLAEALGRTHSAAYTAHLHRARLDQPFTTSAGLVIADFISPRRTAMDRMPLPVNDLPVAFYKDANIRNFVITNDSVAIVDFDDLTLAPFGYDLAKLTLSTAMTFGHINCETIERALEIYNAHTAHPHTETACSMHQLRHYLELHHQLTARYLHTNGYRHPWPDVRPWPQP